MVCSLWWRAAAVALLCVAMTGCGGGSGAGSGTQAGAAASDPPPGDGHVDQLSIRLRSPGPLSLAGWDDLPLSIPAVQIEYTGPASVLEGKTLHVAVETAAPLTKGAAELVAFPADSRLELRLPGDQLPAGRHTGEMKIHVCLDAGCTVPLGNSPLALSYDADVKPGLKLSRQDLTLSSIFGTSLPPVEIDVSLPFGATEWTLLPRSGDEITPAKVGDKLLITPSPFHAPGRYSWTVTVASSAPDLQEPARNREFRRELHVDYTIAAEAPFFASPNSASFTVSPDIHRGTQSFKLFGQDPRSVFTELGIRYDSSPAAAMGRPNSTRWILGESVPFGTAAVVSGVLEHAGLISVDACPINVTDFNCLPPGTYTGAVLIRHSAGGVNTDFEIPVTMNIVP